MKKFPKDPFKDLVLNEYEQKIEDSLAHEAWKSVANLEKRKKELQEAAHNTLIGIGRGG